MNRKLNVAVNKTLGQVAYDQFRRWLETTTNHPAITWKQLGPSAKSTWEGIAMSVAIVDRGRSTGLAVDKRGKE